MKPSKFNIDWESLQQTPAISWYGEVYTHKIYDKNSGHWLIARLAPNGVYVRDPETGKENLVKRQM